MSDSNLGEVVNLNTGLEAISSNSSVLSELRDIELVGGAWELEPEHFADVSQIYLGQEGYKRDKFHAIALGELDFSSAKTLTFRRI